MVMYCSHSMVLRFMLKDVFKESESARRGPRDQLLNALITGYGGGLSTVEAKHRRCTAEA